MIIPGVFIVCGGREYRNEHRVFTMLDAARDRLGLAYLIEGGADGADRLARIWRAARRIAGETIDAEWDDLSHPDAIIRQRGDGQEYDARAGVRRNQRMLDEGQPEGLIAFPGGSGTRDMVRRAEAAGIRVIKIDWR